MEYKTLENEHKAEYPAEWKVNELKGDTLSYDFAIPLKGEENWMTGAATIDIGLDGAKIRLSIDPQMKGMFNEYGSISESIIHFLKSFQTKKSPQL